MKKLYILRHAKAAHNSRIDDHERPLTEEGLAQAALVAAHMAARQLVPGEIICSTAVRTRDTAAALELPSSVQHLPQLYLASAGEIFRIIQHIPNTVTSLLVCGHNAGLHQFAALLARSEAHPGLLAQLSTPLPTATLVTVECPMASWHQIEPGAGKITGFYNPANDILTSG